MTRSAALLALVGPFLMSAAGAAVCDRIVLPQPGGVTHDYQVVLGEMRRVTCFSFDYRCNPDHPWDNHFYPQGSPPVYGACVRSRPRGQDWQDDWFYIPATGCDGAGDADTLEIHTGPGHDRVTAMLDRYQEPLDHLSPYPMQYKPFYCTADGTELFGVPRNVTVAMFENLSGPRFKVFLGAGRDQFYGSDREDTVYSNTRVESWYRPNPWSFPILRVDSPADHSRDELCGLGGNDVLIGDRDPANSSVNAQEYIVGGNGFDQCYGDVPPALMGTPSTASEGSIDGRDDLHCEYQRQGRAGRIADPNQCGAARSSPYRWRDGSY